MENEDVILTQMEDTRTALTEKLETLETQVAQTVQGATTNVAETVEAVKETVETVKETVQETVATVKDSVAETISTVKESVQESLTAVKGLFDVPAMVRAHPCITFWGSVAAGFVLEEMVVPAPGRRTAAASQQRTLPPDHGEDRFQAHGSSFFGASLLKKFEPEINRLKGLALGKLMCGVRDMISTVVPENMAPQVHEVLDNFTHKLGGEVFNGKRAASRSEHGDHGNTADKTAAHARGGNQEA